MRSIFFACLIVSVTAGCPGLFPNPGNNEGEGEAQREGEGQNQPEGEGEGQSRPEGGGEGDGEVSGLEIRVVAEFIINDPEDGAYHRGQGNAILPLEDGGYVIVGTSTLASDEVPVPSSPLILRVSAEGALAWWLVVDDGSYLNATLFGVVQVANGNFVAGGVVSSFDPYQPSPQDSAAFLVHVDRDGSVIESQSFRNAEGQSEATFRALAAVPGGGAVAAGSVRVGDQRLVFAVRTDDNGQVLWASDYENESARLTGFVGVSADGGFLVAGTEVTVGDTGRITGSEGFFFLKLDENGVEQWSRSFPILLGGVLPTDDGGAVLLGTRSPGDTSDQDLMLSRVDVEGSVLWSKAYDSGEGDDMAVRVRATADGGFILAGNAPPGPYVVRVDKDGNELGALVHPIDHGESFRLRTPIRDIRIVSEGVYVLVGYTELPELAESGSPSDIYVLKLVEEESISRKVSRTPEE